MLAAIAKGSEMAPGVAYGCACCAVDGSGEPLTEEHSIWELFSYPAVRQTSCSAGCEYEQVGDGVCDAACDTAACGFDDGDCNKLRC